MVDPSWIKIPLRKILGPKRVNGRFKSDWHKMRKKKYLFCLLTSNSTLIKLCTRERFSCSLDLMITCSSFTFNSTPVCSEMECMGSNFSYPGPIGSLSPSSPSFNTSGVSGTNCLNKNVVESLQRIYVSSGSDSENYFNNYCCCFFSCNSLIFNFGQNFL